MTSKQLIQRLSEIEGDLPIVIQIDLHGPYRGIQKFEVEGSPMSFGLLGATTHLCPEDIAIIRRSASPKDCEVRLRTRVGTPDPEDEWMD